MFFLKRCNKRRYTSELINIYYLLEKCDRRLFTKIKSNVDHPFCQNQLPGINTERFKNIVTLI